MKLLLRLSVLAAAAVATLALLADAPAAQRGKGPMIQNSERVALRAIWFGQAGLRGEYCFQYDRPSWKPEYDQGLDDLTLGKRVRLGKDFWSSFDTFCDVEFGGKKVKAGDYFLLLGRSKKGAWNLVLADDDEVRTRRLDAFSSESVTGGIEIPLEHADAETRAETLTFELVPGDDEQVVTFRILWGPHVLSAELKAKV